MSVRATGDLEPLPAFGSSDTSEEKVQMRGNGEGGKGTCWAPGPGVGGVLLLLLLLLFLLLLCDYYDYYYYYYYSYEHYYFNN